MFDGSVGQNNPVVVEVFFFVAGLPLNAVSYPVVIFRMHEFPVLFTARTFLRI
jgi:hypothetical protein